MFQIEDFTIEATYVPPTDLKGWYENGTMLKYTVAVYYKGRHVVTTPYSMGLGHIPGWVHKRLVMAEDSAIQAVLKSGKGSLYRDCDGKGILCYKSGPPILPAVADVVGCLATDGSALDYASFEDWASNYGYDTDSRKAEGIYRQCLDTGLRLKSAMGAEAFQALLEWSREL